LKVRTRVYLHKAIAAQLADTDVHRPTKS